MFDLHAGAGDAAAAAAGGDAMDESDEDEPAVAGSSGRQAAGQTAELYNEIGQHNPKKAKAGVWGLSTRLCAVAVVAAALAVRKQLHL
jgi:hypothetical protein